MLANRSVARVVELADEIYIETTIPRESHAALRSGFAGYPSNPRWTVRKFQAWKQGKQWRREMNAGMMVVENKCLVLAATRPEEPKPVVQPVEELRSSWRSPLKKFAFSLN
jgi:hypothetical protein